MMRKSHITRWISYVFLLVAGGAAMAVSAGSALAQKAAGNGQGPSAALAPLPVGVSTDSVFAQLVARNEERNTELAKYTCSRTYQVLDLKGKVHAEIRGQMEYRAPDTKSFQVTSEAGAHLVRKLALHPLIDAEISAATGKEHRDSSFTPANYTLILLGEEQIGPSLCFVARAVPKRKDKYLFEGTVWIDARDYALVRIEGHPARKLSFWVQQADILRQYENINGFWLPKEDKTLVRVRFYGRHILAISYQDYALESTAYGNSVIHNAGGPVPLRQVRPSDANKVAAAPQ
ncbi:MAG: hypothetical protein ACP5EP_07580 [Acidobacteriaceae bacterium]